MAALSRSLILLRLVLLFYLLTTGILAAASEQHTVDTTWAKELTRSPSKATTIANSPVSASITDVIPMNQSEWLALGKRCLMHRKPLTEPYVGHDALCAGILKHFPSYARARHVDILEKWAWQGFNSTSSLLSLSGSKRGILQKTAVIEIPGLPAGVWIEKSGSYIGQDMLQRMSADIAASERPLILELICSLPEWGAVLALLVLSAKFAARYASRISPTFLATSLLSHGLRYYEIMLTISIGYKIIEI